MINPEKAKSLRKWIPQAFLIPFPLWIRREPAFLNPFHLLIHFLDAPEAAEGSHPEQRRAYKRADQKRSGEKNDPGHKESPLHFPSEIIFPFNHQRMKKSYYQKST